MQMVWKKSKRSRLISPCPSNLPFHDSTSPVQDEPSPTSNLSHTRISGSQDLDHNLALSELFQSQGNILAEEGKYGEALGKWEAALALTPEKAILHEQKAQVLLEIGETWKAVQAATCATKLQPSWPEAWITLARAQLNFGEPELSFQSAKKALELQPNCKDARVDMETAQRLMANKRRLEQSGLKVAECRYIVCDRDNGRLGPHKGSANIKHGSGESSDSEQARANCIPDKENKGMIMETVDTTDDNSHKVQDGSLLLLVDREGLPVESEEPGDSTHGKGHNMEDHCQNKSEWL